MVVDTASTDKITAADIHTNTQTEFLATQECICAVSIEVPALRAALQKGPFLGSEGPFG